MFLLFPSMNDIISIALWKSRDKMNMNFYIA